MGRLALCDSIGPSRPGSLNRSSSEIKSPTIVVRKFGSWPGVRGCITNVRAKNFSKQIRDTVELVVCHALYILKEGFGRLLSFKLETS